MPHAASLRAEGFTIIELLVVITIIVVLLALLSPAMDRAIYQAELAVCGAQLHSIAAASITYTMDYKRAYPRRWDPYGGDAITWAQPFGLGPFNLGRQFKPYVSLKAFVDPLVPEIDLDESANTPLNYIY